MPPSPRSAEGLEALTLAARLLFANGQTTRQCVDEVARLARRLGWNAQVLPAWGQFTVTLAGPEDERQEVLAIEPTGVDINKVVAVQTAIDQFTAADGDLPRLRAEFQRIDALPSGSLVRFAVMAGAGAAALGIIFGATDAVTLLLIALTAALGAVLRRGLAGLSRNPYLQPFGAALLAGLIGGIVLRLQIVAAPQLVAFCPCMILVPGPHFLNAALDLARARLPLGLARFTHASLTTLMICAGLVVGMAASGASVPPAGAFEPVPLLFDVLAAGVAVAAYATFFNMPWRMLPIPLVVGMAAHACRWLILSVAGWSVETAVLCACLLVGTIITPITNRLRLPFAGVAFASVVSMLPGVYLFRLAGGMAALAVAKPSAAGDLVSATVVDAVTAILIVFAMALGLIVPRLALDQLWPADPSRPA